MISAAELLASFWTKEFAVPVHKPFLLLWLEQIRQYTTQARKQGSALGLYTPHLPYVFLFLQKFLKNLSGNQTGPHLEHATDYLFHFEYNTLKTITKTKTDQCQKQANSRDLKKKNTNFYQF